MLQYFIFMMVQQIDLQAHKKGPFGPFAII